MKLNTQQKGFTLIEIMMALALTGIVLVMGGYIYKIFTDFQYRYQERIDRTYDTAILHHQLHQDLTHAWQLEAIPNGFILQNRKGEPQISYYQTNGYLIRSWDEVSDSLPFQGILLSGTTGIELQDSISGLSHHFYFPERSHAKNP